MRNFLYELPSLYDTWQVFFLFLFLKMRKLLNKDKNYQRGMYYMSIENLFLNVEEDQ